MSDLRKDYFTENLVIIESRRTKRSSQAKGDTDGCEYCPGNEEATLPADLVLIQKEGSLLKMSDEEGDPIRKWNVRVFREKDAVVRIDPGKSFGDPPRYSEPAFGYHYVIVATPDHNNLFSKMDLEQWVNVLVCIQDKARWLYSQKGVSYVAIYIDNDKSGGDTKTHPHVQMVSLPRIPPVIEVEANAVHQSITEFGSCPMCRVLNIETGGPRQLLATDLFMTLTPWASTNPYEFWIVPKKHQTSILKATQIELEDLALALRCCLGGLAKALKDPGFTLVLHNSSEKKTTRQIHWHIEVRPNSSASSGLALASGVSVNEVSPEKAAEVLGAASRKEIATLLGVT